MSNPLHGTADVELQVARSSSCLTRRMLGLQRCKMAGIYILSLFFQHDRDQANECWAIHEWTANGERHHVMYVLGSPETVEMKLVGCCLCEDG